MLFSAVEFLILVFAIEFRHFAAAVFLAGVGYSACSVAENVLLYDSLLSSGSVIQVKFKLVFYITKIIYWKVKIKFAL